MNASHSISVVISPFRARDGRSQSFHGAFAKLLCLKLAQAGRLPFAPHVACPPFLDEMIPEERATGIEIGKAVIAVSGELCVWDPWGIEGGMKHEIAFAEEVAAKRDEMACIPCRDPLRIRYFSRNQIPEWNAVQEWLDSTGVPAGQLFPVLRDFKGV